MSTTEQPATSDVLARKFRFSSLVGGVLVAYPAEERRKGKERMAICIRVDDEETAWRHYCKDVDFILVNSDETACRYRCGSEYMIASCRIIRDCDDLPEAIALASKDLWSTAKPHIFN